MYVIINIFNQKIPRLCNRKYKKKKNTNYYYNTRNGKEFFSCIAIKIDL